MDEALTLTVVGCSGSVSGPDSPASSYLIQAPAEPGSTFSLLLDCGPGSFGALYRYLDPAELDAVGLSHLHPDHCLDLLALYVAAHYSTPEPWPPVDLFGPPDSVARLSRAYDPAPSGPNGEPPADLSTFFTEHEWAPQQQIGPLRVLTTRVAHPVRSFATRVEFGTASLVYSGDTGPSESLVALAEGADVLVCEAGFLEPVDGRPPNPPALHLTGYEAGQIAAAAGVGQLVLTHIPPWHDPALVLDEARTTFSGPVQAATAGLRVPVG